MFNVNENGLRVSSRNALHNCHNPYQGKFKKVLCVCSAGLLRSPTAAFVLSQEPFNFNTRACGLYDYALVHIDEVLLDWADEVVCMDKEQELTLRMFTDKPIIRLDVPDMYSYRAPELVDMIRNSYIDKSGFGSAAEVK